MNIKEIAAEVRLKLKKQFPDCKFSVRKESYSMGQALHVSLMEAPFQAFKDGVQKDSMQVNSYQFSNNQEPDSIVSQKAWGVLKKVSEISQARNWNKSDAMIDYFDVNYYFHLNIGQYNKAFKQTK